ncbi:MAG: 23S rRNA (pseudouridine(1915)-N(3))-methyltransferase RlmH [Pseudomonadota bacterium]|nr:23S rRNA (pseudouridine(1915)-N(3))-methyltransferase RlmH [Pseudomonadota bacterium]
MAKLVFSITLITIGNKPPTWLQGGYDYYLKLLKNKYLVNPIHLNAVSTKLDKRQRENKETAIIQEKIKTNNFIIALDENSKSLNSLEFSSFLIDKLDNHKNITFIIGPSDGLSNEILNNVDYRLSLSCLTYTHDLAKLVLLEQIFRAQCIAAGHPYHRV